MPRNPLDRMTWRYQEGADVYTHIVRATNNEFICQLPHGTKKGECRARLIAAAPDLYEALEPFVRAWAIIADQPNLTQSLSLAQIAELAHHELSAADFQRACHAFSKATGNQH